MDALLKNVSGNTADLTVLQDRLDERVSRYNDVREEMLKQKDNQLKSKSIYLTLVWSKTEWLAIFVSR